MSLKGYAADRQRSSKARAELQNKAANSTNSAAHGTGQAILAGTPLPGGAV
jgi:hypothetical protein